VIINLRYHIASLVSIFLALGLGILIGGIMLKSDFLAARQKQITDRLEEQVGQLRQNNKAMLAQVNSLQAKSDLQKDFARQTLPFLVKGCLEGYKIALVETSSYGIPDDLIFALQSAGAKIQSITTVLKDFQDKPDQEFLVGKMGVKKLNGNELSARIAGEIGRAIVAGDNMTFMKNLVETNMLKLTGEYGGALNAVIIVGGSRDSETLKTQTIDLSLIDYLLARKIPVYGVEETDVLYSCMKEYQKKRISTVDNIDTIPGQVALVLAMSGKPGNYGVKSTAQKIFPSLN